MNRFGDIDVSFKRLPPVYGFHSEDLVPIEKALESIGSQIRELPFYIEIAKQHCHFPSEHGLTKDESAAIYIYTMEWGHSTLYRVLNKALRSENRQALEIWFPYLKLFDTALDKLPTVKENLWRGVPLDIGKDFQRNQLFTWWSVNSCSSSVDVIKSFLGDDKRSTLFLIEAVNGKKISGYTEYENEDEVILTLGTRLCVKANPLDYHGGLHVVHLVEIDNNNDEKSISCAMNEMHVASKPASASAPVPPPMMKITANTRWNQNGITIAGGHGAGNGLNQLNGPWGLYIDDDDQTVYIADTYNHRIVEWKYGATSGQVVAGCNVSDNQLNQLEEPTKVIVDKTSDSLIISDQRNSRVVRWPRQDGTNPQTVVSNVCCYGLVMNDDDYLYVSDSTKHEVRRWRRGDTNGTVVAGGNGHGHRLDQLNSPRCIFVDEYCSVFVSDRNNHRVMKWMKGAKEGIVVAGGQGSGNSLLQLSNPRGVIVDHLGTVYVADSRNNRVMRWSNGTKQGSVVVGGNGQGVQPNQLYYPQDLSFDRQGNIYVVDQANQRVQRFDIL